MPKDDYDIPVRFIYKDDAHRDRVCAAISDMFWNMRIKILEEMELPQEYKVRLWKTYADGVRSGDISLV